MSAASKPAPCCRVDLQRPRVGIGRPVEHRRTHRGREQRCPHTAEFAAVTEPEVRHLLDAERLADGIDVACRVVRTDELEGVDPVDARLRVVLGELDQFGSLGIVVWRDVGRREVGVVIDIVDAIDGTLALAHTTRIPTDHIEVVGDVVAEPTGCGKPERCPIGSGAAAIGEQRTSRWIDDCTVASEIELDGVTLRVGVVDRHGDGALVDAVAELGPFDRVHERLGRWRSRFGGGLGRWIGDAGDVA